MPEERFCKANFTSQNIVEHLQEESFTDNIFKGYETQKLNRLRCSMNSGSKSTKIMPAQGKRKYNSSVAP